MKACLLDVCSCAYGHDLVLLHGRVRKYGNGDGVQCLIVSLGA